MTLFKIRDDQRWKIEFNFLKKIRVSSLQCVERFNCVLLDYIVSHMGPKKNIKIGGWEEESRRRKLVSQELLRAKEDHTKNVQ